MEAKKSTNLCSTYILPLLGLSRYSFGPVDKFINSYVSTDDEHIVVECSNPFTLVITCHANFKFSMENNGIYTAVFSIPTFYKKDVEKFKVGKYSQFSNSAKDLIRKKSGLKYKVPIQGGGYRSAMELLALDKDKELKKYWEGLLNVELSDDAELASIPGEDNFYDLNLSTQLTPQ